MKPETEDAIIEKLRILVKEKPGYLNKLENFVKNEKKTSNKLPFKFTSRAVEEDDNVRPFPSKMKVTREFIVNQLLDRLACLDHEGLILYNDTLNKNIVEDAPEGPGDAA